MDGGLLRGKSARTRNPMNEFLIALSWRREMKMIGTMIDITLPSPFATIMVRPYIDKARNNPLRLR